jgi:8-oxo-dGTP pyrophosphatase MutT (NUDIX family)
MTNLAYTRAHGHTQPQDLNRSALPIVTERDEMTDSMFRIAVTCIICAVSPELGREYLILKRSSKEVHGKEKWTVAGGTIEEQDWKEVKSKYNFPLWYDVAIKALKREVLEETGLIIGDPEYLCDCVFIHKTGVPEIVLSFFVTKFGGKLKLSKEHTDYAWITVDDLDKYNLLIDIPWEIREVDKIVIRRIGKIINGN